MGDGHVADGCRALVIGDAADLAYVVEGTEEELRAFVRLAAAAVDAEFGPERGK